MPHCWLQLTLTNEPRPPPEMTASKNSCGESEAYKGKRVARHKGAGAIHDQKHQIQKHLLPGAGCSMQKGEAGEAIGRHGTPAPSGTMGSRKGGGPLQRGMIHCALADQDGALT